MEPAQIVLPPESVPATVAALTTTCTEAHVVFPQSPSALTKYVVVVVGLTFIDGPLPIDAPLAQPPAYHFHIAPVPNDPPTTLILVLPPIHIGDVVALAPDGAVEAVFTVTVTWAQDVFPQSPSALTKYVVVVVGLTVMVGPVPIEAPLAHPPAYHFQNAFVPNDPPVTLISVLCPGQIVGDIAEAPVGAEEGVFTVTVTDAQVVFPQSPYALT